MALRVIIVDDQQYLQKSSRVYLGCFSDLERYTGRRDRDMNKLRLSIAYVESYNNGGSRDDDELSDH
jgi:hypothetical protein